MKTKIEFGGTYRIRVAYTTKGFDWAKWKSFKKFEEYLSRKTKFTYFWLERSRRRAVSSKVFDMAGAIKMAKKLEKEPLIRTVIIEPPA